MLMAVVASFTGPSVASTIRLLDGDPATDAASESHLPLDMAAAPDQATEAGGEWTETDTPTRVFPNRAARFASSRETDLLSQTDRSSVQVRPCILAHLCVYRL